MRTKRVNVFITQWLVLSIILPLAVGSLVLHFTVTTKDNEREDVKQSLVATAEEYAEDFTHTMESMMKSAKQMDSLIENSDFKEAYIAHNIAKSYVDNTDAYMAIICNLSGRGIMNTGETVNLSGNEYLMEASGITDKYMYCEDDGVEGRKCIVVVCPLTRGTGVKGYFLAYYDVDEFAKLVDCDNFSGSGFFAVVDENGKAICSAGKEYSIFSKENLWNGIIENGTNTKEIIEAKLRYDKNKSGITKIESEKESDKVLFFAPTGINGWKIVVGINNSYVDATVKREWKDDRDMLMWIVFCMAIFAAVAIVSIVMIKFREKETNRNLTNKADIDSLTGMYNKVSTEARIKEYVKEHPEEMAVLFVLDVDNFKKINDTMGHAFGDEVLRSLGTNIRGCFRASDVLGRIGGDEFMILLKNMKNDETILKEARKLEYFFKDFKTGEYTKYSVTASIGAAVFPRDAKDFESLYKVADKALYTAKQRGKNQLAFYNEDILKNRNITPQ